MIEKYIDVLFKAVEIKDVELIMFVLSKDITTEKLKLLRTIKNYKEGNIYEHLLYHKENEMLKPFLESGLLNIINEPINEKGDLFIDLAYRYKNLPLILSLIDEEKVNINIKTNGISFLEKVTTTFTFENTILSHMKKSKPELDIEKLQNAKIDCELLSKITVDESAFPDTDYKEENIVEKIFSKDKQVVFKNAVGNFKQSLKNKINELSSDNNKLDKKENKIIVQERSAENKRIDEVEEIVSLEKNKNKGS